MNILRVEDLRAYYFLGRSAVRAVDGISIEIQKESIVGIVGESGSGKTTLARVLSLDITPPLRLVGGKIEIEGEEVTATNIDIMRKKLAGVKVSIIPQSAMNALVPVARIRDIVIDIMRDKKKLGKDEILHMARRRLEELNLPAEVLSRYPFELSGGMRQRVLIAIATLLSPTLLIADEPTSALDVSTQKIVLSTLYEVFNRRFVKSLIFISHDIATVRQIASRMVVMYAGEIVEDGPTDKIIADPMHPYSKILMNSILTPELKIRERLKRIDLNKVVISGEPPSLSNPPPGCRFHPRCPFAMEICRKEKPPLITINDRRVVCWLYTNSDQGSIGG
ncbi:MAG: ABC transporter ATP-binding protein [Sulfolobales archaeon]